MNLEKNTDSNTNSNTKLDSISSGIVGAAQNPAFQNMGLTPGEIVKELDRFIVGQKTAKKAVAIALRNRYRRMQVIEPMRSEIMPKNILMIGSTGVGKTEIARRLAKLAKAPFIKVEATKFTEIGYVGRDVESIIRDLTEIAVNIQKTRARHEVEEKARAMAIERVLDVVAGKNSAIETRKRFYYKILHGELDQNEIEIAVSASAHSSSNSFEIPGLAGAVGVINISEIFSKTFGSDKTKQRKLTIKEAIGIITAEESDKLLDQDKVIAQAIYAVENDGIVFLDEIDKITSRTESKGGEVSREGVQRDLLPLIEGTNVVTKYGTIATDHILFIASGAFHLSKPSDLLPELQGRLPIRVEMTPLTQDDLIKILIEPECSLIKQYVALLATEKVELEFTEQGIAEIAAYASRVNLEVENIGARRLHTILEKLLEDISYDGDANNGKKIIIDKNFVEKQLTDLVKNRDMAKFIL